LFANIYSVSVFYYLIEGVYVICRKCFNCYFVLTTVIKANASKKTILVVWRLLPEDLDDNSMSKTASFSSDLLITVPFELKSGSRGLLMDGGSMSVDSFIVGSLIVGWLDVGWLVVG
jgi:hypothetical protein